MFYHLYVTVLTVFCTLFCPLLSPLFFPFHFSPPFSAQPYDTCTNKAEEIVPVGSLDPDHIHVPSVFVNRIVKATTNEKRIERLTLLSDEVFF